MGNLEQSAERRAVLIAGPTASGKSALALRLAERQGGVVINADSMQVYAELSHPLGAAARPKRRSAPHRLYGHVPAARALFRRRLARRMPRTSLDAVWQAARLPIIVGGTGLYFKALTEGLAAVPTDRPARSAAGVDARADADGRRRRCMRAGGARSGRCGACSSRMTAPGYCGRLR